MSTATFVKPAKNMRGDASVYRLNPPREDGTEFVVASAVNLDLGPWPPAGYRTSETMVFPWDAEADDVADWDELAFVPYMSHADALADMGYEVA